MADYSSLLGCLLRPTHKSFQATTMRAWFTEFKALTSQHERSIERAILGGRFSPNVGFAFAAGYQSAIESLFAFNETKMASFCVTEEQGNHPRAINTVLESVGTGYRLQGSKKFVSGGSDADVLFVACKVGETEQGLPQLKMVKLPANQKGVAIKELPTLPFIPEISHGAVTFDGVELDENALIPGDGYSDFVKPFRTYEDLHVLAAILSYRLGEALRSEWEAEAIESHLSLLLSINSLAEMSKSDPSMHLALAGCRSEMKRLIESTDELFEKSNPEGYASWVRDKAILGVAGKAHKVRTEKAWQAINSVKDVD